MNRVIRRQFHQVSAVKSSSAFLDSILAKVSENVDKKMESRMRNNNKARGPRQNVSGQNQSKSGQQRVGQQRNGQQKQGQQRNGQNGQNRSYQSRKDGNIRGTKAGEFKAGVRVKKSMKYVDNDTLSSATTVAPVQGKYRTDYKKSNTRRARPARKIMPVSAQLVAEKYSPHSLSSSELFKYSSLAPVTKEMRILSAARDGVSDDVRSLVTGDYSVIEEDVKVLPKQSSKLVTNFGVVKNLLNNNGTYDYGLKSKAFFPCVGVKSVKEMVRGE